MIKKEVSNSRIYGYYKKSELWNYIFLYYNPIFDTL